MKKTFRGSPAVRGAAVFGTEHGFKVIGVGAMAQCDEDLQTCMDIDPQVKATNRSCFFYLPFKSGSGVCAMLGVASPAKDARGRAGIFGAALAIGIEELDALGWGGIPAQVESLAETMRRTLVNSGTGQVSFPAKLPWDAEYARLQPGSANALKAAGGLGAAPSFDLPVGCSVPVDWRSALSLDELLWTIYGAAAPEMKRSGFVLMEGAPPQGGTAYTMQQLAIWPQTLVSGLQKVVNRMVSEKNQLEQKLRQENEARFRGLMAERDDLQKKWNETYTALKALERSADQSKRDAKNWEGRFHKVEQEVSELHQENNKLKKQLEKAQKGGKRRGQGAATDVADDAAAAFGGASAARRERDGIDADPLEGPINVGGEQQRQATEGAAGGRSEAGQAAKTRPPQATFAPSIATASRQGAGVPRPSGAAPPPPPRSPPNPSAYVGNQSSAEPMQGHHSGMPGYVWIACLIPVAILVTILLVWFLPSPPGGRPVLRFEMPGAESQRIQQHREPKSSTRAESIARSSQQQETSCSDPTDWQRLPERCAQIFGEEDTRRMVQSILDSLSQGQVQDNLSASRKANRLLDIAAANAQDAEGQRGDAWEAEDLVEEARSMLSADEQEPRGGATPAARGTLPAPGASRPPGGGALPRAHYQSVSCVMHCCRHSFMKKRKAQAT